MKSLKSKLDSLQQTAQERTVKTQTIEYDLETLVKKIERGVIKLNPDYQRRHRWPTDVSAKLIESLILNIPVPLIYISQDVDVDEEVNEDISRYSVIDGQQRLTAIYKFFKNEFPLTGLDVLDDLNDSYYKDLPPFLIRRLEERTIRCLRIDSTLDSQVKYDIFERLNSGSVKLEAQELRNATCRGPFKDLIKKLSKDQCFIRISQLDPDGNRVKKMEDEELVLRFFALAYKSGYKEYKGKFKQFLTNKMETFNTFDSKALKTMETVFLKTMAVIEENLGDEPFAKYRSENGRLKKMSSFNAAVYDSIVVPVSVSLSSLDLSQKRIENLFSDADYFTSIEGSVNDVSKLNLRITKGFEAVRK